MAVVEYTFDNVMKCICSECPVQRESSCIADKATAFDAARETGMSDLPPAADLPGLYCSTGTAACGDLDFTQSCLCPGCQVYTENQLDQYKYCERGSAAEIG